MHRSILAVLLVLLLVFAGCNGIGFGDTAQSTQTVTPASVPTDEPTPTPVPQLAPGLKRNSMNVTALAQAHNTILQNTSFTQKTVRTARYPNGTLFSQEVTISRIGENGNVSSSLNRTNVRTAVEVPDNVSIVTDSEGWIEETRVISKNTLTNNTTTYTERPLQSGEPGLVSGYTGANTIQRSFSGTDPRVTDVLSRNGTTLYRVNSTVLKVGMRGPPGVSSIGEEWIFKNLSQANQQALISPSGVVHRHQKNYKITTDNNTLSITLTTQYTNIGSTTVERPPWYGKAPNTSGTQTPPRIDGILTAPKKPSALAGQGLQLNVQ